MKKNTENPFWIHFQKELAILESNLEDEGCLVIDEFIPVIKIITEIFSSQGHSGGSAPHYSNTLANTIKNVLAFKPLSPIHCHNNEWNDVSESSGGNEFYQNNRLSSIFKKGKYGTPYYLSAIVWQGEDDWDTFTGRVQDISSSQNIKTPFTPKTFYIDVIKVPYNPEKHSSHHLDCSNNKYSYEIKNPKQLDPVKEYYDFKE